MSTDTAAETLEAPTPRSRSGTRRTGRPSLEDLLVVAQATASELIHDVSRPAGDHEGDSHWTARGLCAGLSPDELFVQGPALQREASEVCFSCPVRLQCLADALDSRTDFGVWGGLTERERRALRRRRPEVTSWYDELVTSPACEGDGAVAAR